MAAGFFTGEFHRETGEFGLSIPTDLAVMGAFGSHPDHPVDRSPIEGYTTLWVNLATLIRNAYRSFDPNALRRIEPSHVVEAVKEDMELLPAIFEQMVTHDPHFTVVFYHNSYRRIGLNLPQAIPRQLKTNNQRFVQQFLNTALERLLKDREGKFKSFDFNIKGEQKKTLMLSHQPVDLLSHRSFLELALLESHTGVVKPRDRWHSKFSSKDNHRRIPFDKGMIQLFGDGNNMLSMYPTKVRRKVLEIAERNKWTYLTTKDKILVSIGRAREPELKILVSKMYR